MCLLLQVSLLNNYSLTWSSQNAYSCFPSSSKNIDIFYLQDVAAYQHSFLSRSSYGCKTHVAIVYFLGRTLRLLFNMFCYSRDPYLLPSISLYTELGGRPSEGLKEDLFMCAAHLYGTAIRGQEVQNYSVLFQCSRFLIAGILSSTSISILQDSFDIFKDLAKMIDIICQKKIYYCQNHLCGNSLKIILVIFP